MPHFETLVKLKAALEEIECQKNTGCKVPGPHFHFKLSICALDDQLKGLCLLATLL
jgi:hypothetical protein